MATIKFKDTTLTLLGNEVKAGQAAPGFQGAKKRGYERLHSGQRRGQNAHHRRRCHRSTRRCAIWKQSASMRKRVNSAMSRSWSSAWICRLRRSAGAARQTSTRSLPPAITATPRSAKIMACSFPAVRSIACSRARSSSSARTTNSNMSSMSRASASSRITTPSSPPPSKS